MNRSQTISRLETLLERIRVRAAQPRATGVRSAAAAPPAQVTPLAQAAPSVHEESPAPTVPPPADVPPADMETTLVQRVRSPLATEADVVVDVDVQEVSAEAVIDVGADEIVVAESLESRERLVAAEPVAESDAVAEVVPPEVLEESPADVLSAVEEVEEAPLSSRRPVAPQPEERLADMAFGAEEPRPPAAHPPSGIRPSASRSGCRVRGRRHGCTGSHTHRRRGPPRVPSGSRDDARRTRRRRRRGRRRERSAAVLAVDVHGVARREPGALNEALPRGSMIGPEHLQILQPLGADQATFVARETSTGEARLAVVERVTRASPVPAARAELLRRGRALRSLEHPKVVRVHDVFERDGEVIVVSDYVDGEWLSSFMMMNPRPPLGVMLRLVIDVLEGLGALHALKDENDQMLEFVHGAIGPDTVLVADDGVAEIARACRLPRAGMNERYVAPELRRGGDSPPDPRSDVYAAGAILRDVLADAGEGESWAESLTDIAWRACSVDEENRWPTAAAMATAIRRVAGPRLATAAATAELVRKRFGARMQARRKAFEALRDSVPPSSEPLSLKPSEMELLDASEPTLVASKTPPLPLVYPEAQPTAPAPPAPRPPPARPIPAKKPTLVLEAEAEPPDQKEPETKRRPETTPLGLAPVPPQRASITSAPLPPAPPPPPAVSLPPPTIVPDVAAASEQFRRQMPTFPTFDPEPPRRRVAAQGFVVAGGMILTFAVGWWLGRAYAPASEASQATCASAPTVALVQAAPATPSPPVAPSVTASAGLVAAPPSEPSGTVSAAASSVPAVSALPAALAAGSATAVATAGAATPRPAWVQDPAAATAPRFTAAPPPSSAPATTATASAAKPQTKPAGYVPEEL